LCALLGSSGSQTQILSCGRGVRLDRFRSDNSRDQARNNEEFGNNGSSEEESVGVESEDEITEREYSDDTAKVIDQEVEALITEAATRARVVIKANLKFLEALKDKLLEKETVDADEVHKIFTGTHMPKEAALY